MIHELAERMASTGRLIGRYLPHYVSVCITKFDDPMIFQQARRMNLVGEGADGQFRVPDNNAQRFFEMYCSGEFWHGNENEDQGKYSSSRFVYDSLRTFFAPERTRYFVISSVGLRRGRDGRVDTDDFFNVKFDEDFSPMIRGPIEPVNVMEPLVNLALQITQVK